MKVTILHISDPHWIYYDAIDTILAQIEKASKGTQKAKAMAAAAVRQQIELEVADYEHISSAFTKFNLARHRDLSEREPSHKVLALTGDLANFYDYHKHVSIKDQFREIKKRLIPLLETKGPFDLKLAIPGNHDVDKSTQSPDHLERFKDFYGIFDDGWETSLKRTSVCIGEKPNQIRIWLVNSCKRCGIDVKNEGGRVVKMDTVQIFTQDQEKWSADVDAADRMRIALMHHSPVPNDSDLYKRDVFTNNRDFNGTLMRTNVKVVLSGHHHIGDELYAAMPSRVQQYDGGNLPISANPLIESGFLSLSAPTFLRQPKRAGYSQGFNVIDIEITPDDNIVSVTVTKYRFTSEGNNSQFVVHGSPLNYRIALLRLQEIHPDPVVQERRIAILTNAAREIYSKEPIEPLERILGMKLSDETASEIDKLIVTIKKRMSHLYGMYSVTVLSPAAWWANQLTRRFRVSFIENINRAIDRGASPRGQATGKQRLTALFKFSRSLFDAVQQALIGANELHVSRSVKSKMNAELFTHEERIWIHAMLGGTSEESAGASLSRWGRRVSVTPYDENISGDASGVGSLVRTIVEESDWDIPNIYSDGGNIIPNDAFEVARIAYWPIEDFDSDYALRVIEFHEDFHVPLFWLSPRFLLGRKQRPRKSIGALVICDSQTTRESPLCVWNNLHGDAPTQRDLYQLDNEDEEGVAAIWGTGSYPRRLQSCLTSGAAELRALFRRPDILFASDVWALRKMNQTDILTEYLTSMREKCSDWLET